MDCANKCPARVFLEDNPISEEGLRALITTLAKTFALDPTSCDIAADKALGPSGLALLFWSSWALFSKGCFAFYLVWTSLVLLWHAAIPDDFVAIETNGLLASTHIRPVELALYAVLAVWGLCFPAPGFICMQHLSSAKLGKEPRDYTIKPDKCNQTWAQYVIYTGLLLVICPSFLYRLLRAAAAAFKDATSIEGMPAASSLMLVLCVFFAYGIGLYLPSCSALVGCWVHSATFDTGLASYWREHCCGFKGEAPGRRHRRRRYALQTSALILVCGGIGLTVEMLQP